MLGEELAQILKDLPPRFDAKKVSIIAWSLNMNLYLDYFISRIRSLRPMMQFGKVTILDHHMVSLKSLLYLQNNVLHLKFMTSTVNLF